MSECRFKDVKINDVTLDMAVDIIRSNLENKGFVCMNDVRNIIRTVHDAELREAINASLLSLPDGMPLVWYCKLLSCRNAERITGFRIMKRLMEAPNGLSHFLLGDTQKRIAAVMDKAREVNPEIVIKGYSPPFKQSFSEADNEITFERVRRANPDLIWVSLGGGKQEKWMRENIHRLNQGVMIGVGAAFKFYLGELTIAPQAAQALGLQWIWRLRQDWSHVSCTGKNKWQGTKERLAFFRFLPFEMYQARRNMLKRRTQ